MAELEDLHDQVFRGIGRNVLNLQKMEGMLKFIVYSTGEIGSTVDVAQPVQNLEKSIKNRRNAIKRLPMGRLVENLSKTFNTAEIDQPETTNSEIGYSIKISFFFEDDNFTNELSHALREIVVERNSLVHKKLISFDHKSVEGCRELIRDLDEQRARIKPQYEALYAICLSLKDSFRQLKDYTDSESFADDLERVEEEPE